jgi:hypothetical protein
MLRPKRYSDETAVIGKETGSCNGARSEHIVQFRTSRRAARASRCARSAPRIRASTTLPMIWSAAGCSTTIAGRRPAIAGRVS